MTDPFRNKLEALVGKWRAVKTDKLAISIFGFSSTEVLDKCADELAALLRETADAEENLADYLLRNQPPTWDYAKVLELARAIATERALDRTGVSGPTGAAKDGEG